ncbi:MAG TPA: hypothetical protein VM533_03700 [Fimbriiglobus sp.]|jgi:hypothetical protein|nr:hypothetical protein [Fimbriiglobus sp.]
MTLAEYMSPKLFPLTTQPGLTPRMQFMIDAVNYDQLREYLATGVTPTEEQWIRLSELEDKARARPALMAQLGHGDATGG